MSKFNFVMAIAGGTGSGKTTAAKLIAAKLKPTETTIMSFDDYYRYQQETTLAVRAKTNYDHPNSLEADLLEKHLKQLKSGRAIEQPVYDFTSHNRTEKTVQVKPTKMVIVEGILALSYPELRRLYDYALYMEAPADIRFIRRLERDTKERGRSVASVIKQYLTTVRPMHEQYVEPTKKYGDKIVSGMDGGGDLEGVVEQLRLKLYHSRELYHSRSGTGGGFKDEGNFGKLMGI